MYCPVQSIHHDPVKWDCPWSKTQGRWNFWCSFKSIEFLLVLESAYDWIVSSIWRFELEAKSLNEKVSVAYFRISLIVTLTPALQRLHHRVFARNQRSNVTRRFSFSSRLVFERTGRMVHFTTGVKDGTRLAEWDGEGLPARPWRRSLSQRCWLATWDGMPPHLAGDRAGNGGETINKGRFKAERNGTERHPPPASHNLKQRTERATNDPPSQAGTTGCVN